MVELKLESIEEQNMPRDCFISVRVGETQKLSRLAATRVYKFPQAGERRYGKIEVFRRIGACSVDIDPSNVNLREISVDCKESGFGCLGLRIAVDGDEASKKKLEDMPPEGKKAGTKVRAAKDYLSKHGLEVRLSEAMQAVLRDRPENPTEYLAMKLLGHTPGDKLPPPAPGDNDSKAMPEQSLPVVGEKSSSKAILPFGAYHKTHFQSVVADIGLFSKFQSRAVVAEKPAEPSSSQAAPLVPMLPFGSVYYKKHFCLEAMQAFASLHAAFPPAARQTEPDIASQQAQSSAPSFTSFKLKPSVGTWCKPSALKVSRAARGNTNVTETVPTKAVGSDCLREKAAEGLVSALDNGELDKAVGSLGVADEQKAEGESLRLLAKEVLLSASEDGRLQDIIADTVGDTKAGWLLKPSVGTWCTPLFVGCKATSSKDDCEIVKEKAGDAVLAAPGDNIANEAGLREEIEKCMQAPSPLLRVRSLAYAATAAAEKDPVRGAGLAKAAVDTATSNVLCGTRTASPVMNPGVATGFALMAVSAAETGSKTALGFIISAAELAVKVAEDGCEMEKERIKEKANDAVRAVLGDNIASEADLIEKIEKYMQAPSPLLRVQSLAYAATAAAKIDPVRGAGLAKAAVDAATSNLLCGTRTASPVMNPGVATGFALMAVSAAEAGSKSALGLIIAASEFAVQVAEEDLMSSCQLYSSRESA